MNAEITESLTEEEPTVAPADGDIEAVAVADAGDSAEKDTGAPAESVDVSDEEGATTGEPDGYDAAMEEYGRRAEEDARELRAMFPELSALSDIAALPDPIRFAELRDLGLSAREAYLATSGGRRQDNRAHLRSAYPSPAHTPAGMSDEEMRRARELFSDLSDTEIRKLYKRISG